MIGVGAQHPKAADGTDPRGWLVFTALPDAVQNAEDSTAAADRERHQLGTYGPPFADGRYPLSTVGGPAAWVKAAGWGSFVRPATTTERALLAHLGYELPTDELPTLVSWPTDGVRCRRWPTLENTTTQEVPAP